MKNLKPFIKWILVLIVSILFFLFIHLDIIKFHSNNIVPDDKENNSYNTQQVEGISFGKYYDPYLNVHDTGTIFNKGIVYIRLQTKDMFRVPYLYFYVYKMKGLGFSLYDKNSIEIDPETNILITPYKFLEEGTYRIVFRKNLQSNLQEAKLTIE